MLVEMNKRYVTSSGRVAKIITTSRNNVDYPVIALVGKNEDVEIYTKEGKHLIGNATSPLDLHLVTPYHDYKVDAQVLVRDSDNEPWIKRHFAREVDGKPYVWSNGKTSFTSESDDAIPFNICIKPSELGKQ